MSGHSKWATTKHKKAVVDAKRGKLFAKLIKNVEVAARTGGGDPAGNPTLFDAIQKAKKSSVPNDNIDRAVRRGSRQEAGGAQYDAGIDYESADAAFLPSVEIELDEDQAKRVFKMIDTIEDSDDVQDVYANYSVSDDVMEKIG